MSKKPETRITVRFPSELINALRPFTEKDKDDRSLNWEIAQAVREYVARKQKMIDTCDDDGGVEEAYQNGYDQALAAAAALNATPREEYIPDLFSTQNSHDGEKENHGN